MAERVVVIGADATGASAASTLKRLRGDDVEVIVLDRGEFSSYSACGIPYWIAGDVASRGDLIARTPERHRENGIDLRMRQEVESIDVSGARVNVRDLETGRASDLGYDQLVIATGARPIRPDLPGIDAPGVCAVNNLTQATHVQEVLARGPQEAVVVGAGYIGIEMAEALLRRGLKVTVVDSGPQPMGTLDPELGVQVREAMQNLGLIVRSETKVTGFETDADGHVRAVRTDDGLEPADLVVLGIGVRPEVALAKDAGLTIGDAGGIRTDDRQRVEGAENIWAGGDCVEVWDRLAKKWATIALGTHANAHGRVIGANLAGKDARFPGVLGTAISKVCNLEVARTGLGAAQAADAGYDAVAVTIESTTSAGYLPHAGPIAVKLIAERGTGRLIGGQIVGRGQGAGKRIDTIATALWAGLTAADLAEADLSYAPPFSPVRDPVAIAAAKAAALVA
jgi:NADPH-dependent 2,4-dienoyl-CoA reductase/sulfur reductase-like enzyme